MSLFVSLSLSLSSGLTREDLASLPVGVALPLWDSIFNCRENPPPSDDLRLYELIGTVTGYMEQEPATVFMLH